MLVAKFEKISQQVQKQAKILCFMFDMFIFSGVNIFD